MCGEICIPMIPKPSIAYDMNPVDLCSVDCYDVFCFKKRINDVLKDFDGRINRDQIEGLLKTALDEYIIRSVLNS